MRGRLVLLGLLVAAVTIACSERRSQAPPAPRPLTYTTNYPLAYFAQRIAGEAVEVRFPAPADVDPAHWEPETSVVEAYQQADLVLLNGAEYERWVERASLPASRLVNTSSAFEDEYIPVPDALTHSHGPRGKHTHAGFASHTWLDPQLALRQAEAVRDALVRLVPSHRKLFEDRFGALAADLSGLDRELARVLAKAGPLLASHPVYQYLERRYGLRLVSFHWEPRETPSEGEWRRLERVLARHRARLMLWEAEPLEETAARLARYDVRSVVFDPCSSAPAQGDYLEVMRANIARLERALTE